MPWLQAHLTVSKEQAPLVELLFEDLGALSVTLADAADEPMLEPAPGETPLWSATRISGLFAGETDADDLRSRINQSLNADISRALTLERVADREWERAWLDNFKPMRFGKRLWICPSGSVVREADAVVVSLDPGLAFGTGTHPTTALCLAWLDGADLHGKTVIDYGCGSGILAIAAVKLGAARVIAVDHDPQAILATRDNAARNQVGESLEAVLSRDFQPIQADVVLANILANILVELSPRITALVDRNGKLIMSGILQDQAAAVITAYRDKMDFAPPVVNDGWVRLDGNRHR